MMERKKVKLLASVELWNINKWLRWTGLRLAVIDDDDSEIDTTKLGLIFWGWSDMLGSDDEELKKMAERYDTLSAKWKEVMASIRSREADFEQSVSSEETS